MKENESKTTDHTQEPEEPTGWSLTKPLHIPRGTFNKENFLKTSSLLVTMILLIVLLFLGIYVFDVFNSEEGKNKRSSPGDFYKDYLGDDYSRIRVEIDYVEGNEPDQDALDHFQSIIQRETEKDIQFSIDDSIPAEDDMYDIYGIQDLEDEYRDHYRSGNTAVIYFLYLNGEYEHDSSWVGIAYHGSSIAIFAEQIRSGEFLRISPMERERAVLVHEAGHLLALVELKYESDHDHHDDAHDSHCTHTDTLGNHDCVMYYQIRASDPAYFDSYYNQLQGDIPNDFCVHCQADLAKLRDMAR